MSLPGFGILSSNMKTSRVWEICQTEAPIFAVFADHPKNSVEFQLVVKSSWLTASLQTLGIGIVLPIRSSLPATGPPVLLYTGFPPAAL